MSIYICEKCGTLENTALGGYWRNALRKEPPMCSECNTGKWHNEFPKQHWSEIGIDELLRRESLNNGSMINARVYLQKIGAIEQSNE